MEGDFTEFHPSAKNYRLQMVTKSEKISLIQGQAPNCLLNPTCFVTMFSSSENGISALSWSKYLFYFSGCEVAHIKRETDDFLAHLLNIR